jgi:excisionase family DNA binding protein
VGPSPLLARLLTDPQAVERLQPEELLPLVAELEQLKLVLLGRYLGGEGREAPAPGPAEEEDILLTAEEVAQRLGVSKRWVYEHASGWPFSRRLGRRTVRFSARGLERWMQRQRGLAQRYGLS